MQNRVLPAKLTTCSLSPIAGGGTGGHGPGRRTAGGDTPAGDGRHKQPAVGHGGGHNNAQLAVARGAIAVVGTKRC